MKPTLCCESLRDAVRSGSLKEHDAGGGPLDASGWSLPNGPALLLAYCPFCGTRFGHTEPERATLARTTHLRRYLHAFDSVEEALRRGEALEENVTWHGLHYDFGPAHEVIERAFRDEGASVLLADGGAGLLGYPDGQTRRLSPIHMAYAIHIHSVSRV